MISSTLVSKDANLRTEFMAHTSWKHWLWDKLRCSSSALRSPNLTSMPLHGWPKVSRLRKWSVYSKMAFGSSIMGIYYPVFHLYSTQFPFLYFTLSPFQLYRKTVLIAHLFLQQRILRNVTLFICTIWTHTSFPSHFLHDSAPSRRASRTSKTALVAFKQAL